MKADCCWQRLTVLILGLVVAGHASGQKLLVPMDDDQANHLKAYGLTYNAIKAQQKAAWLLNYRGGTFLLPDLPELRRQAALDGITVEQVTNSQVEKVRAEMAGSHMEAIQLE